MTHSFRNQRFALPILLLALVVGCGGCGGSKDGNKDGGGGKGKMSFMSLHSAPTTGAFFPVGGAITDALTKNAGENNWQFDNKSSQGSQANIRDLDNAKADLALSNSAISYFAVNGQKPWDKKYKIRTVVTLAPNVAMFITKETSGIKTIADLKGKRVMIGPDGAGFRMFAEPLLKAHGVSYDDFTLQNGNYGQAVDSLKDGATDAAFVGGAVPMSAIQRATTSFKVHFIPLDTAARDTLVKDYPFFDKVAIPADTYKGQTEEYPGMNVGSMHLITSADMDEEVVYQITKIIWENRSAIRGKHPAGRAINKANAARFTGTPFHPGAIRFYKEIEIWKEPAANKAKK